MDEIAKKELRHVLGAFITGVTVMTTLDEEGRPQGCTVNSFSSVSLRPPLVLWSQALNARSAAAFQKSTRFVVNILAEDQVALSNHFASNVVEKFDGVTWMKGIEGMPILNGCSAYLECSKHSTCPGGDHVVYFGRVEKFQRVARTPLVFASGRYMAA